VDAAAVAKRQRFDALAGARQIVLGGLLLAAAMMASAAGEAPRTALWSIDSSSSQARFELRALGLMVIEGHIDSVEGEVWRDADGTWVQVRVALSTLRMSSERRARWALSEEFFHAAAHPILTYTAAVPADARMDRLGNALQGVLNLRGIEAPIRVALLSPECDEQQRNCRLRAHAEVSRRRFGMMSKRLTLSDSVSLDLRLDLRRNDPQPPADAKTTSGRSRGATSK
jgi:polyisoprenoid-binding protein YceI